MKINATKANGTENYFIISAYGAFTPGYSILITKKLLSSFAAVQNNNINCKA